MFEYGHRGFLKLLKWMQIAAFCMMAVAVSVCGVAFALQDKFEISIVGVTDEALLKELKSVSNISQRRENYPSSATARKIATQDAGNMQELLQARGYFEGKYRDKNAALLQAEYRSPFLWRFGLVAFGGYGAAFDSYSTFKAQYLRFNYGAGLRLQLDQKQKINIRIDYGRGYQSSGFYFTIGEAF